MTMGNILQLRILLVVKDSKYDKAAHAVSILYFVQLTLLIVNCLGFWENMNKVEEKIPLLAIFWIISDIQMKIIIACCYHKDVILVG